MHRLFKSYSYIVCAVALMLTVLLVCVYVCVCVCVCVHVSIRGYNYMWAKLLDQLLHSPTHAPLKFLFSNM